MKSSELEKLIIECIRDEHLKNNTVVRAAVRSFLIQVDAFGPIDIYLTGSRFFGGVHNHSDWNFLVDSDQVSIHARRKPPALKSMSVGTSFLLRDSLRIADRIFVPFTFRGINNAWETSWCMNLRKSQNRLPPKDGVLAETYWADVWMEAHFRSYGEVEEFLASDDACHGP